MRTRFAVGTVGAMVLLGAGVAFAYSGIGFSGGLCQPWTGPMWHHTTGAGAEGTSLTCPISYPLNTTQQFTYNSVQVEYNDGSSSSASSCYPYSYTAAGGVSIYGTRKYTCSGWGGCPDSTSSYTGHNALFWNSTESFLGTTSGGLNAVYDYSNTGVWCYISSGVIEAYRFTTW